MDKDKYEHLDRLSQRNDAFQASRLNDPEVRKDFRQAAVDETQTATREGATKDDVDRAFINGIKTWPNLDPQN